MAETIAHSVGEGGKNHFRDVLIIQLLLRSSAHLIISDWPPGTAGKSTIEAIRKFQKEVVKLKKPDGLISPGGSTIKALTFVKLPSQGKGYYSYGAGVANKQWGTYDTVESVKRLAARVKDELSLEIGVSDISLRKGGKLSPHVGHKNGTEIDIRPLRQDGLNKPCWISWKDIYDRDNTKKLVEFMREDPNTKKILFNDKSIPGVKWATGHHHHLHVYYSIKSHPYSSIQRSFEMMQGKVERGLAELLDSL